MRAFLLPGQLHPVLTLMADTGTEDPHRPIQEGNHAPWACRATPNLLPVTPAGRNHTQKKGTVMPYYNPGLNAAVDGIATAGTYISFHTADPGSTGTSQTGSRVQTTWAAASNGSRAGSQVSANIGAGVTVTHWGIWSAATGGTFLYSGALAAPEAFGSAGTLQHTPTITVTN